MPIDNGQWTIKVGAVKKVSGIVVLRPDGVLTYIERAKTAIEKAKI